MPIIWWWWWWWWWHNKIAQKVVNKSFVVPLFVWSDIKDHQFTSDTQMRRSLNQQNIHKDKGEFFYIRGYTQILGSCKCSNVTSSTSHPMSHLTQYGLTITLVKRTSLCLFLDSIGTHPITLIPITWHAESLPYLLAPVVARTKLCPRAPRMWTVSCLNSEQTLMSLMTEEKGLLLPILSWLAHFRTRVDNCKTSAALNR